MRILLITHETSRTGAPRVAAVVARGLLQDGHDLHVEARSRGPLLPEFESIAPTNLEFLFRVRRRLRKIRGAGLLAFLLDSAQALGAILRWRPDLVYVNSTAAAVYVRPALWLRRRVILHVHESGEVASEFLAQARLSSLPQGVEVVACSPSVKSALTSMLPGIADRVHMIASVPDDAIVLELGGQIADWDVANDDLVVGGCGAVEQRKGVDLWMEAACRVRSHRPEVRFVWIGDGDPPEGADAAGVEFIGPRANPYPYIRRFDVFTLPSRDDPFPLVVLEAMLLARPVVAFDVGGVSQQVGEAGIIAAAADVDAFARAIGFLLRDADERRRIGEAARQRAVDHFSTAAFLRSISELVDESPPIQAADGPRGDRDPSASQI